MQPCTLVADFFPGVLWWVPAFSHGRCPPGGFPDRPDFRRADEWPPWEPLPGGRTSEEIVLGDVATDAQDDLQGATDAPLLPPLPGSDLNPPYAVRNDVDQLLNHPKVRRAGTPMVLYHLPATRIPDCRHRDRFRARDHCIERFLHLHELQSIECIRQSAVAERVDHAPVQAHFPGKPFSPVLRSTISMELDLIDRARAKAWSSAHHDGCIRNPRDSGLDVNT